MVVQSQVVCFAIAYYYSYHYGEGIEATNTTSFKARDFNATDFNAADFIATDQISFTNTTDYIAPVPKIGAKALWSILLGLLGVLGVNVGAFFSLIDSKYLKTFTTTDTGRQFAVREYYAATTDEEKIGVFGQHPIMYSRIESELIKSVHKNWAKWKSDQPDWFTADVIATIPDKFIPVDEVKRMDRESGVGQRRKSSVADALGLGGDGKGSASVVPIGIA